MISYDHTRRLRHVSDRDVSRLHSLFLDIAHSFDAKTMCDRPLFPPELTWFYGEPVYDRMTPEGRLKLNHLTFTLDYMSSLVTEAAICVLNYRSALRTLMVGDPEVSFYMAREAIEETFHQEAFYIIIRKILAHYGIDFEEFRRKNKSLHSAVAYADLHTVLGWIKGDYNFYYFTRFPLNIALKTVERSTIADPRIEPLIRELLRNHAIDEARHMQMSRETGVRALAAIPRGLRQVACVLYAHYAAALNISGRHKRGSSLNRQTRTAVLELCGVSRKDAVRAYEDWRDRKHMVDDPPLVQAVRHYYVRQNFNLIDDLNVSDRMRAYMRRTIDKQYRDVTRAEAHKTFVPLVFEELSRTS
jgi:hypothetical protein